MKAEKNSLYWSYNLPLQLWPSDDGTCRVLNYMPRKECVITLDLDDVRGEQTREEYLEQAALVCENLAALFRKAKADPQMAVYYPDADPDTGKASE